jgi:hypothetical protein
VDPSVLRTLAGILPWTPVALALLAGGWGIRRFLRAPVRDRADRRTAAFLAVATGLVTGAFVTVSMASVAVMFTANEPNYAIGLALGAPAAILTALGSIAGYVAMARPTARRGALAGVVAGPIIVIAGFFAGGAAGLAATNAAYDAEQAMIASQVAQRSTGLTISVGDVSVTTAKAGTVIADVEVHVVVHAPSDIGLDLGSKLDYPRFTIVPADGADVRGTLFSDPIAGGPATLAAGSDTGYDVKFTPPPGWLDGYGGTFQAGAPGSWLLTMSIVDASEAEYQAQAKVAVVVAK